MGQKLFEESIKNMTALKLIYISIMYLSMREFDRWLEWMSFIYIQ